MRPALLLPFNTQVHRDEVNSQSYFNNSYGPPLQYPCLENSIDGGAWWAAVHGVAKSRTRLRGFTFIFHFYALEKDGSPLQYSCLKNPSGGGAWWAAVYGVAQSRTRLKRLSSREMRARILTGV